MKSEYKIISNLITEGSKVLDVGCDDGTLMEFLKETKSVNIRGIEISKQKVQTCISKGLTVIEGNAEFDLKVYELTYFLNSLDPAKNFESTKVYYSNEDYFEKGFYNSILHDETITLNFDELRFNFKEDDPTTEDVDETTRVETRLSPRIRVPLDTTFFQERILDMEGTASLESNAAFQRALKGIIIRTNK